MAHIFRSRILPIGGQGAKDNTVMCVYAWEACTSKIIANPRMFSEVFAGIAR